MKQSPTTESAELPPHITVGQRVSVQVADQPSKPGTIAYVGPVHFKPGTWVGVVYDEAVGKNDGSIDGHRYFHCEQGRGGFVVPKSVYPTEV